MVVRAVTGFLWLIVLTLMVGLAQGRVRGMPLLQRFSPDDYQAEAGNLAVLALPNGILYVGNVKGLLRFDGGHWDRLELPKHSLARGLALGPDGRVYVGGYDQFGVVTEDPTGRMHYQDLRPAFGLDPKQVSFGTVWTVLRGDQGVYFQTSNRLFYLADDGNHRQWAQSEDVRSLFPAGSELYARVHGRGLCRFSDGAFELIPGGALFADQPLLNLLPHEDGLLLVAVDGFHLAGADGIHALPSEAGPIFAKSEPYSGMQLPDGGFVFGTHSGELLHFSKDLHFKGLYPIGAFTALEVTRDREGGVWAATEGDLVRLRIPAPWSQFGADDGLIGSIFDTEFHLGDLWVATSQGVFRSHEELGRVRFSPAIATTLEASALHAAEDGLLVGDREGVLWLTDGADQPARVAEIDSVAELRQSRFDPAKLYVLADQELVALQRDGTGWRPLHRWAFDGIDLSEFHEASATEFWLGDLRGGAIRWRIDPASGVIVERRVFGAAEGLIVDDEFGTLLFAFDGEMYAVSGDRVFSLRGSRFDEVEQAPFNLVDTPSELEVTATPYGTYAATSAELWRRLPGASDWQPVQLGSAMARGYYRVHVGKDKLLRVITWNGLLQFDPGVAELELPPLEVGLRSLSRRTSDGQTTALPIYDTPQPIELAADATLTLDFRVLSMEQGSEFRVRIPGLFDDWTEWNAVSSQLIMRNTDAGDYTIEAQGRTRSGRNAQPLLLNVHVAPLWWNTRPAWVAGLLTLLLVIGAMAQLVARIRYRQFVAINRRLERKITERTAELEAANRKLSELATEDSLTGVANRRALEQALLREWDRCRELNQPLSLIMVDVDHFKQFNDVHGHLAGDQQLIRVARILATHAKPVRELLARFGGEEFALVLPGITIEDALQRAETMRRSFIGPEGGPTVSSGVAAIYPTPRHVPDDLVRAADMALYAAKRAGRNRVMRAAPLLEPNPVPT